MTPRSHGGGLALVAALLPLLAGCSEEGMPRLPTWNDWSGWGDELRERVRKQPPAFTESTFEGKRFRTYRVEPSETVIGSIRSYRVRAGETLLDVARYYDLGYNEIVDANPSIDPWVPPAGANVVVPTAWVLPCCTREGIVLNIPEMRLYYFHHEPGDSTLVVDTYPVGLGRDDWRTPRGTFRVATKTVNPNWNIPESIRREHLRERGDGRKFIPGGDPDNPLGKYRLQLSHRIYGIHGTNIPWGVGMQVTHGCVRLYPEDIEHLYPLVPVGTPVEFTYQTVKVGSKHGVVYVEAHRDIYGYSRSSGSAARAAIERLKLDGQVDPNLLRTALDSEAGLPVAVSADQVAREQSTAGTH
jgi:L,D-transpeptidase ErfK/SrfK